MSTCVDQKGFAISKSCAGMIGPQREEQTLPTSIRRRRLLCAAEENLIGDSAGSSSSTLSSGGEDGDLLGLIRRRADSMVIDVVVGNLLNLRHGGTSKETELNARNRRSCSRRSSSAAAMIAAAAGGERLVPLATGTFAAIAFAPQMFGAAAVVALERIAICTSGIAAVMSAFLASSALAASQAVSR